MPLTSSVPSINFIAIFHLNEYYLSQIGGEMAEQKMLNMSMGMEITIMLNTSFCIHSMRRRRLRHEKCAPNWHCPDWWGHQPLQWAKRGWAELGGNGWGRPKEDGNN